MSWFYLPFRTESGEADALLRSLEFLPLPISDDGSPRRYYSPDAVAIVYREKCSVEIFSQYRSVIYSLQKRANGALEPVLLDS